MNKELAIKLLSSKGVYLTSEGKRVLQDLIKEKTLQRAK